MSTEPTVRATRRILVAAACLLVAVAALLWWRHGRRFESTDDAQVEGHLHAIGARVTGTVLRVGPDVQDNHYVEAGTLLVELDPTDYDVALEQARATLATREAAARAASVEVPIVKANVFGRLDGAHADTSEAQAGVAAAEATRTAAEHRVEHDAAVYAHADRDRQRYLALVDKREISRSEYDARATEAAVALETLEADRAALVSAQNTLAAARSRVAAKQAAVDAARTAPEQWTNAVARSSVAAGQVRQARADVRAAELNLQYTKIYAPVGGVIGRKTVEVGHRVQPGQTLLVIVPVDDIWVTADFKETQVQRMRPGQPATVYVDAFGRDYPATVEGMPGAAGTLFSLLPPENASGNFVKVVQRLPVRIRFEAGQDPQHRLRPGMSVEARVKVD